MGVLDAVVRLAQPVMPFLAESLFQAMNEAAPERGLPTPARGGDTVTLAPWPAVPEAFRDAAMEDRFARMAGTGARRARSP